jgi:hypothetical protein
MGNSAAAADVKGAERILSAFAVAALSAIYTNLFIAPEKCKRYPKF